MRFIVSVLVLPVLIAVSLLGIAVSAIGLALSWPGQKLVTAAILEC
jgi:hypothetical protein